MARGSSSETQSETPTRTDPTVTSTKVGPEYPEGTHPPRPVSETTYAVENLSYRDNPDKPDSSSIAQLVDIPEGWPGQS